MDEEPFELVFADLSAVGDFCKFEKEILIRVYK
jgi:hypothetical protein